MNFKGKNRSIEKDSMEFETISKYMAKKVITFSPDQAIASAIDTMLEERISGGPVLNEKGELVGILSEKDCLKIILDRAYHNHPNQKNTVKEYMTTGIITVDINSNVVEIADKFLSCSYRRFPVLENGKLKGQVSRRDIMRATRDLKSTSW